MGFALNDTIADDLRTDTNAGGAVTYTVRVSTHRSRLPGDDLNAKDAFRWMGDVTVRHNVIDMLELQSAYRGWRGASEQHRMGDIETEVSAAVRKAIAEHCEGTVKSFELPPVAS